MTQKLDITILELLESSMRNIKAHPLNLGGVSGQGGGAGGPPGGFIGWLPQTRVAYDDDEIASSLTSVSGSLLDNLNHIRARIGNLETASGGSITVIDDMTATTYGSVDTIHFSGGVVVTNLGSGDIRVTVSGGGGGTALTVKEVDGSPIIINTDTIIFSGMTVVDQGGGDALVYPTSTYFDTRYLKLDASNDPLTSTLTIQPSTGYTDGLVVETTADSIVGTLNQLTVNDNVTSAGVLLQRQSTGTGNITGALLDLREYDFGAGVITGDFAKFTHEGATIFKVTRDGSVDIAASQEYRINGTAVVTSTKVGVSNGDSHNHTSGAGAAITDANLSTSDITTNNADTTKHGFLKKLSNVSTEFMNGVGNWVTIAYSALSGRPTAETSTADIFSVTSPGGASIWTGTISGTPSGTSVTVSAPVTGTEAVLVPTSTSQLAKMRLYNLTRGNSALISNYNTGTNVVTLTATVPGTWANGDSLTVASQTVSGGGGNWVDLEITSGPTGKTSLFVKTQITSATATDSFVIHPFSASFSTAKYDVTECQVANRQKNGFALLTIISNVISITWSGSISSLFIREAGYLE